MTDLHTPGASEIAAYIDWLRTSLCSVCKAGFCSAHQPGAGYLDALVRQGLLAGSWTGTPDAAAEAPQVIEAARRLVIHWSHPRPRAASVGYDEAEHRGKAMLIQAVRNLDARSTMTDLYTRLRSAIKGATNAPPRGVMHK